MATSPNVAKTPVSASSSGIPAATSAPNVTSRMRSVIGSESIPALPSPCRTWSATAFWALASPISPMKKSGWAAWAASRRGGPARSCPAALSCSPRSRSRRARRARPSRPSATRSAGRSAPWRCGRGVLHGGVECWRTGAAVALWMRHLAPRGLNPASRILSIRPDSPGAGRVRVGALRADHAADAEGEDDEGQPAERGCLPVVRAPAAHPGGQVALLRVGGA